MLKFSYGCCFTFIQGFVCLALIYMNGFTTKQMFNPWKTYVKLSAVLMGSHVLTKGYLSFLSYPAQIMSKSTKVLPVMIMAAFIPGLRKYPLHEYVSAILLVVGLIQFTLEDASTCPNFGIVGVMMISGPYGALIMGSLGNLHEAFFTLNLETTQVILKSSFIVLVEGIDHCFNWFQRLLLQCLPPPLKSSGRRFRGWVPLLFFMAIHMMKRSPTLECWWKIMARNLYLLLITHISLQDKVHLGWKTIANLEVLVLLHAIFVPFGGGGLIAGIVAYMKRVSPEVSSVWSLLLPMQCSIFASWLESHVGHCGRF